MFGFVDWISIVILSHPSFLIVSTADLAKMCSRAAVVPGANGYALQKGDLAKGVNSIVESLTDFSSIYIFFHLFQMF